MLSGLSPLGDNSHLEILYSKEIQLDQFFHFEQLLLIIHHLKYKFKIRENLFNKFFLGFEFFQNPRKNFTDLNFFNLENNQVADEANLG